MSKKLNTINSMMKIKIKVVQNNLIKIKKNLKIIIILLVKV